ncbi:MAG: hypothetical protein AAF914_08960 [Pseudomonadota bacterium]
MPTPAVVGEPPEGLDGRFDRPEPGLVVMDFKATGTWRTVEGTPKATNLDDVFTAVFGPSDGCVAPACADIRARPVHSVTGRVGNVRVFGHPKGRTDRPNAADRYLVGRIEVDPMISLDPGRISIGIVHGGTSTRPTVVI